MYKTATRFLRRWRERELEKAADRKASKSGIPGYVKRAFQTGDFVIGTFSVE
jgi:hypothetical protein